MKAYLASPIGLFIVCLAGCGGQPLEPWHTANLTNEFVADMADEVQTFDDYLALEDLLFEELQAEVYAETGTGPEYALVRYSSGSAADPESAAFLFLGACHAASSLVEVSGGDRIETAHSSRNSSG